MFFQFTIIFTGWTNYVRNLNAEFIDNENLTIKILWDHPDYDGGVPVQYYKLILYNHEHDNTVEEMVEDSLNTTVYLWNQLGQYNSSGSFKIQFGVVVSDFLKNNRSSIAKTEKLTVLDLRK